MGTRAKTNLAAAVSDDAPLAAKNNQKVSGMSGGVVTIYDPVRDRQRMINQGMGMVMGTCSFGVNC